MHSVEVEIVEEVEEDITAEREDALGTVDVLVVTSAEGSA